MFILLLLILGANTRFFVFLIFCFEQFSLKTYCALKWTVLSKKICNLNRYVIFKMTFKLRHMLI